MATAAKKTRKKSARTSTSRVASAARASSSQKTKRASTRSSRAPRHSIHAAETAAGKQWQYHPYRSFVEGLPVWLAILTTYMFAVVYLQSWTFALVFTLLMVVMIALLLDVLHHLHKHLHIPDRQRAMYDRWLTRFGRGLLVGFSIYFLLLFLVFAFSFENIDAVPFAMGSVFTLIGIGLVFFLVLGYIALIVFIGFPRIRHQLSLASLLFFCYFYLFFAFAVRRIDL